MTIGSAAQEGKLNVVAAENFYGDIAQQIGGNLVDVVSVMSNPDQDPTALDRRVGAKGATDDFAQRLGAVDDEQPADLGIKPALDQIVDERLHDGGVLGCSFDQGERNPFVIVSAH